MCTNANLSCRSRYRFLATTIRIWMAKQIVDTFEVRCAHHLLQIIPGNAGRAELYLKSVERRNR